jgi:hypothetical protein
VLVVLNVATQDLFAPMVTIPSEQSESPVHPANVEPLAGVAVRDTTVPVTYPSEQSVPQLIPAGPLLRDPLPLPDLEMDKLKVVVGIVAQESLDGLDVPFELNDLTR